MSLHDFRRYISTVQRASLELARVPTGGRNFFLITALSARETILSCLESIQVKFLLNVFFGRRRPLPILLQKISQFRTQLMPFIIPYSRRYKRVFEQLLAAQSSWFEGWEKYEEAFIVYGDMVGFSRSVQRHNLDAAIKILNFRHLFFRNFKDKGGYVEASAGDSILGIFEDGDSAVNASINVLRISQQLGIGARIGISYGEYLSEESGRPIIGASINTAVRIADGGSKNRKNRKIWQWSSGSWQPLATSQDNVDWGIWFSWEAITRLCHGDICEYLENLNTEYTIELHHKPLKGVSDGTNLRMEKIKRYLPKRPSGYNLNGRRTSLTLFFGIVPST